MAEVREFYHELQFLENGTKILMGEWSHLNAKWLEVLDSIIGPSTKGEKGGLLRGIARFIHDGGCRPRFSLFGRCDDISHTQDNACRRMENMARLYGFFLNKSLNSLVLNECRDSRTKADFTLSAAGRMRNA
ncbi:hypothetical protein HAX54_050932 [Datura stramonium]|uniref:Uncharacterized protein n=1 Tax=Datura stramonium TaxID=4076 RepID=A0ABS8WLW5_DATST|nr:hypothetical protein [Datura stramonium]